MRTLIVTSLVVPLLLCAAQAHAQQPPRVTEHAELHRTPGNASLEVDAPRPLQQAVLALNEEYGWNVGYEDPQWQSGGPDLVDDTDPTWRASHPNERGVTRLRGGGFKSQYPELPATAHSTAEESKVLAKLVADYNASGNPGKFALVSSAEGHFDVIGIGATGANGQAQAMNPVLDTHISIAAFKGDGVAAIGAILKAVSAGRGLTVVPMMMPTSALMQQQVSIAGNDVTARSLLEQVIAQTGRRLFWTVLYDADAKLFAVNLRAVTRTQYDTFGNKTQLLVQ